MELIHAYSLVHDDMPCMDNDVLRRTRLYVDSREAAAREAGDVIAAGAIFAEIGEVLGGQKAGRQSAGELTLFKSVGVAVADLASAGLVYREALAAGPQPAGDG